MFKPYDAFSADGFFNGGVSTLNDYGIFGLSDYTIGLDVEQTLGGTLPSDGLSSNFLIGQLPALSQHDIIVMLAQVAVDTAIIEGHSIPVAGVYVDHLHHDGCGCADHSHGPEAKDGYLSLIEILTDAADEATLDQLIDMAADLTSVSTSTLSSGLSTAIASAAVAPDSLTFMDGDIGNTAETAGTLSVNGSVSSTRDTSTDADWFAIELTAGTEYTFFMIRDGENPHADPLMKIIGTDGTTVVQENDDTESAPGEGTATQNSTIIFTPDASGTYYISAEGWETTTGDYTIYANEGTYRPTASFDQLAFWLSDQLDLRTSWGANANIIYDVTSLSTAEQSLAVAAMDLWAEVSTITFTAGTSENATLTFQNTEDGAFASTAFTTPSRTITSSTVNVGPDWIEQYGTEFNSYTFQTYIHEVGHALGLNHGGPYNGNADYGEDNIWANDLWNYTVMSYFDQAENTDFGGTPRLVLGLQVADIIAIQDVYGAADDTRATNSTYGFNSNVGGMFDFGFFNNMESNGNPTRPPSLAIYDTGGIDWIDLTGFTAPQRLSLIAETFSDIGNNTNVPENVPLINNISIARGTVIENAKGGSGDDVITGNDADNILIGFDGNDTLIGGGGDDRLNGVDGDDILLGGDGNENMAGGEGNDTLEGGNGNDLQFGGNGNDTINGDAGNDDIYGGAGNDIIEGGAGNDIVRGDDGTDIVSGGDGIDYVYGGAGDDVLNGGDGNDVLVGQSGIDTINGDAGTDAVFAGEGNDIIDGGDGRDFLYGEGGDDNIMAGEGNDAVLAGAGHDTVYGGIGNDAIVGHEGNDTIFGEDGDDAINGNEGNDVIRGAAGSDVLSGELGNDELYGGDGVDALFGDAGDDMLYGNADQDFMFGGDGVDYLSAGTGDDSAFGGAGNDEIYGEAGNDRVVGDAGNDTVYGGDGNDIVGGGDGNDILYGDAGGDALFAGAGSDTLTGGAGGDTFYFSAGSSGDNTVTDFTSGTDVVLIRGFEAFDTFAEIQAATSQVGANAVVDLGGGYTIILNGIAANSLTAGNFGFSGNAAAKTDVSVAVMADLSDDFGNLDAAVESPLEGSIYDAVDDVPTEDTVYMDDGFNFDFA